MNKSEKGQATLAKPKSPKLFGSCRLILTIMCFFALVLLMLVRFNFSMAMVCMTGTPLLNKADPGYIEGEFDWDRTTVANLLASFFYGYIITQIPGGWVADKFGAKISILCGMSALGVTSLIQPISARTSPNILVALRVFQGLASGFIMPSVYAIFTPWTTPEEKTTLMAFAFAGLPVSNIINLPLAGILCWSGVDNGWPLIFYIPGIVCLIWCVLFYFLVYKSPEVHPRISEKEKKYLSENCNKTGHKKMNVPIKDMAFSIPVHVLWIVHVCSAWTFYLIAINLPLLINETFNLGIVQNGLVSFIPYVAMFLVSFVGKLSDTLKEKNCLSTNILVKGFTVVGMVVPAILFCFMEQFDSEIGRIIALTIASAFTQLASSAGFYLSHPNIAGPFAGFLFGFTNTMATFAGFLNPLLIAFMAPNGTISEWQNIFYVGAAIGVLGALVYALFGSNEREHWAKEKENSADEVKTLEEKL